MNHPGANLTSSGVNANSLEKANKKEQISLNQGSSQSNVVVPDKQDKQKVSKLHKADRKESQNVDDVHSPTMNTIASQKPLIALMGLGTLITTIVLWGPKSTNNML